MCKKTYKNQMKRKHTMQWFAMMCALLPMSLTATAAETETEDTLSTLVVTGTRLEAESRNVPFTVTRIDRETLTEQYRTSVLPTVMEQTPGLFLTSRGVMGYSVSTGSAGAIKVRGVGGGAQLLVLIDGQPQYAGLMGHPIADAYQTMMTERVEMIQGPASMMYGSGAMGGVLNIVTRQAERDTVVRDVMLQGGSYGSFEGEASELWRKGRFSGNAGVQYRRTDGHRDYSAFQQYGGFFKIGYDISDHWKVRGDVNLTHFDAENPGPEDAPLIDCKADVTRGLASLSVDNRYERWSGSVRGYYDWGRHTVDDGYNPGGTPRTTLYEHKDFIGGITAYETAKLWQGGLVTLGLDWQHFGGSAWNEDKVNGDRTYLTKGDDGKPARWQSQDEVGVYLDLRQNIGRWVTLDAGARYDWHSVTGAQCIPQGGVSVHVTQQSDIKASVSKGFRSPTIREMYMFPPSSTDLEPEKMMQYEISFTQRFAGKGEVGANVFYIDGDNLITTVRTGGRPRNVNSGDFRNCGIEVFGHYRFTPNWKVTANYSYLHQSNPMEGAPEHKLFVSAAYTHPRWGALVSLQHINGLYLASSEDAPQEQFTLLNIDVHYNINLSKANAQSMTLFVKGENLLAQSYQTYAGYYMPRATVFGGVRARF